jgi:catalase
MSTQVDAPAKAGPPRLGKVGIAARLALIGAILAAIAATFAYLRGWFTPNELTPARFADGFEEVNGRHAGFRRNHAKGLGVSGFFESNGNGVRFSKAAVFQPGRSTVIGRFSLAGGQPDVADNPAMVRGLGLEFSLPDGELWRTAMISLPVFVVNTPQGFYEQLLASKPDPTTGKPDPARISAFLARHPETVAAMKIIKSQPPTSDFSNTTFHSLNAFWFANTDGHSTPVRWVLTPEQPAKPAGAPQVGQHKNYLFDELIAQIHRQPLHWHLVLIVGQAGDSTTDATLPWPESREKVDAGTLTLDHVQSEEESPATDINFDPLVLPSGIAPTDDPLLSARSAVYSQSFTRREGETKQPSAITSAEVRKGG